MGDEMTKEAEVHAVIKAVEVEIVKLNLEEGDRLAIICPEGWTTEQIEALSKLFRNSETLGRGIVPIFCPHGTSFSVIRKTTYG
jgi:hypothetical protein